MLIKKSRSIISIILALAIIMSGTVLSVYAQNVDDKSSSQDAVYIKNSSEKSIWLDGCDINGINTIDAIEWYNKDGKYYFFMPTSADLSSLRMYTNFENVEFNGRKVVNNEIVDLSKNNLVGTITADGKEYPYEVMQSLSIGTIFLTTETGSLDTVNASKDKSHKEPGEIVVIDVDGKTVSYDDKLDFIKGRGNTTWAKDKKPYNIKLDNKANLMGMGTSKKWCLLANAQEHSMMRNKFSYDMANDMGLQFQAESRYTDIYANGLYLGSYQITEKVELGDDNLVNITNLEEKTEDAVKEAGNNDDLETYSQYTKGYFGNKSYRQGVNVPNNPDDITGGYLIETVYGIGEPSGFTTKRYQNIDLKSPEFASADQINYIADFYQDMEDALFSSNGYNKKGKHYSEYIDVTDAAKAYLLQEFCMNIDAGISSMFLFKDSDLTGDGKLHISPVWDFDVAYGNIDMSKDGVHLLDYNKMFVKNSKLSNTNGATDTLLAALCKHQDFNDMCVDVWTTNFVPAYKVFTGENEPTGRLQSYDTYMGVLENQAEMNYTLWDLSTNLLVPQAGKTQKEHAEYLKNWMNGRYNYLNGVFTTVENAKEIAVKEINKVYSEYKESDYPKETYAKITNIKNEAVKDINSATSSQQVTTIKEKAIDDMSRIAGIILYFDNSQVNWEEVYAYWWESSEKISWPGVKAELSDDKQTAKIVVPGDINIVIFSNGKPDGNGKEQTENLKITKDDRNKFVIDISTKRYDADKEADCYNGEWVKNSVKPEPPVTLLGDANLNGKIDIGDAVTVQMIMSKIKKFSDEALINSDYNKDSIINILDAMEILKVLAKH